MALVLTCPVVAAAADGYVTADVNLRAGPDPEYPRIVTLRVGTPVSIQGCVDGYSWCDVVAAGYRGWVAADYVEFEYDNRRVYVPDYGARIGIPVISFVLGAYWDSHYRNRSWYHRRDYWARRPIVIHRPPVHRPPHARPPAHRPQPKPKPPAHRPPANTKPPAHRPPVRPQPPTQRPPQQRPPSNNRPAARPPSKVHGDSAPPSRGKKKKEGDEHHR